MSDKFFISVHKEEDYNIFDEMNGKIKKETKKIAINQNKLFDLIKTDVQVANRDSIIYFDIKGNRYAYAIMTNYKMKVVGSYSVFDPFVSLLEDLTKYENQKVRIVYPRKEIYKKYDYSHFMTIWDSFYVVAPDHRETFLRNSLIWNTENPYYSITKNFCSKDIKHLQKGKKIDANRNHQKFKAHQEGQFRIDEILV